MLHIWSALDGLLPDSRTLGGAVAAFALAADRLTKQLYQHRIINLPAESGIDRIDIRLQTVGRYLNAVDKAGGEIVQGMGRGGPAGFPGGPGSPDAGRAGQAVGRGARRDTLGGAIHETGTARMSADPKNGVLNSYCQTHDVANLYVFGGNAFCSTGDKHPTLTMMALSARGSAHLIEQAKGKKV